MLEIVDYLLEHLTDDGKLAFTFIDPRWTPPSGWARAGESPGLSNLHWRLAARHETKPEMDVPGLLAHAENTPLTWATLVNDDELFFDPDDDGLAEDKPQRAYITFCTPEYMSRLYPGAQIRMPAKPERQHCVIIDKTTVTPTDTPKGV
jgi:hypothetical protein